MKITECPWYIDSGGVCLARTERCLKLSGRQCRVFDKWSQTFETYNNMKERLEALEKTLAIAGLV